MLKYVLEEPAAHTPKTMVNEDTWRCHDSKNVLKADGFDAVPACTSLYTEENNEDEHVVCRGQERSVTHETYDSDPHGESRTEDVSETPNSIGLSRDWSLCFDEMQAHEVRKQNHQRQAHHRHRRKGWVEP